jgi:hypothetical protein
VIPAGIALLSLLVRTVAVPREAQPAVVRVRCPIHEETRLSLPEPLRQLRGPRDDRQRWGIAVESTRPRATLVVRPVSHPLATRLEFRGATAVIILDLETSGAGRASEVRVDWDRALRRGNGAAAAAEPSIAPPAAPSSEPVLEAAVEAPAPAEPAVELPRAAGVPDLSAPAAASVPASPAPEGGAAPEALVSAEMLWASPITIGRKEGLPGQPEMVLVDALRGEEWVWLRFRLSGGAQRRLSGVHWEHGEVTTYEAAADGEHLRVVVRLPRSRVGRQTRVTLDVEEGPSYRFALSAPTLSGLLRSLFR